MNHFDRNLATGQRTENLIMNWMISRGSVVIPVCDVKPFVDDRGIKKGPQVFDDVRTYTAPDVLAFKRGKAMWLETKHKTVFSWHRASKKWVTGIDIPHFEDYCRVQEITGQQVYIMFLHVSDQPAAYDEQHGCPFVCPTGLFWAPVDVLKEMESHRSDKWGRRGMVYWACSFKMPYGEQLGPLRFVAPLSEVLAAPGNETLAKHYGLHPSP